MITSIELGDFLSHSDTKLEFENGVTVFVGENGAGKSSMIDAITFALFGQHTRKSNKSLIKRGSNQGFAKIGFSINGKQYEAVRKIDSKGSLAAKFSEIIGDDRVELAAGERKQFGESMTHEIEKTIGLDFEKLKIASIVQQGELNTIINAKPKEFKELINAIIGIDKLDVASESMKTVNKEFREKTRDVSITCYSKNEVLEVESLSGGEKVSVALALRLGMASLLGASNLNLMILDEPTTHLDAERKKSLVGVLSQLSNISNSETPMQFLIITHDAEIFEDSTVERIYKFESSEQGSKVTVL